MGAGAVVVGPESGQQSVSTTDTAWQNAIANGDTITINSGNGIVATGRGVTGDADYVAPGFTIENNMYVGATSDQGSISGDLYVLGAGTGNPFTVVADGDVSIGSILQVLGGKELAFTSANQDGGNYNLFVGSGDVNEGIMVGDASQSASLTVSGVGMLQVDGSVITYGDFDVADAGYVSVGQVNVNDGEFNVDAHSVYMGGLVSNSSDGVQVSAGMNIDVEGTVQNNVGDMTLTVQGVSVDGGSQTYGIYIGGSLENKSAGNMTVNVSGPDDSSDYALQIQGIVSNENANATMTINADELDVRGGDGAYSLVNNGDFYANITGQTYLKNGFSLAGMGVDNVFHFQTGALEFSYNDGVDQVLQSAFTNHLNDYKLVVTDGDLNLAEYNTGIVNGTDDNKNANMLVAAQGIRVNTIQNNGNSLSVQAGTDLVNNPNNAPLDSAGVGYGNLIVDNFVSGAAGAQTELIASNILGVMGDVTNQGNMLINGGNVLIRGPEAMVGSVDTWYEDTVSGLPLGDVVNQGENARLEILAPNDQDGIVAIVGNLVNTDGQVDISAKNIAIAGVVTNNSGVTNIRGSDGVDSGVDTYNNATSEPIYIGSVNVAGGVVNLDAQAGGLHVGNRIDVADSGALNFEKNINDVAVAGDDSGYADGGIVSIAGDITASDTAATGGGDLNIALSGPNWFDMYTDSLNVGGDISVVDDSVARNIGLWADRGIDVGGDVDVQNKGALFLFSSGESQAGTDYINVAGDFSVTNGAKTDVLAGVSYGNAQGDVSVGALNVQDALMTVVARGITANTGNVDINGMLYFGMQPQPASLGFQEQNAPTDNGLIIDGTEEFTLATTADGADISLGGLFVNMYNKLILQSADALSIAGRVDNAGNLTMNAGGAIDIQDDFNNIDSVVASAQEIQISGDLYNESAGEFTAIDGDITVGNVENTDTLTLTASGAVSANNINNMADAVMNIDADTVNATGLTAAGQVNVAANTVDVYGNTVVTGDLVQGGISGGLNLDVANFVAQGLSVSGNFDVQSGDASYDISGNVAVIGNVSVADGAGATVNAKNSFKAANLTNAGMFTLNAEQGVKLDAITNNSGELTIDSGDGLLVFDTLTMNAGNLFLDGHGLVMDGPIATGANLYQGYTAALGDKDINIQAAEYEITTSAVDVAGINQSGKLVVNTSDVTVDGDITATDLRFVAQLGDSWTDDNPELPWMLVDVAGDVSGGVEFIGLEKMHIGGNYVFDQNSALNAVILPYATGAGSADVNYWATVSLAEDNTLGDITNAADGAALIQVDGMLTSGVQYDAGSLSLDKNAVALADGQIGINLFNVVDQGTAIWLLHADKGVENFSLLEQMRNLDVKFCNADGSLCYNYLDSLRAKNDVELNGTDEDLPAYISVRDSDGDGQADSLYVVFDPRFGGPVLLENLKIQPIVGRELDHTMGEYVSAGALDDLLIGQAHDKKFLNGAPLEIVPIIFAGTNMEEMANELYNRMEYYVENSEGKGLARFSRLFQVREIELLAGAVSLNEHTNFRSFEDRMYDEFIWNRNRQLKKAWLDVDYGMFYQNIDDGKHTDGNRFSIAGGFDWQESNTLVLGLTGRVSHSSASAGDAMDLGYLPGQSIAGNVTFDVADTDVAVGGYLMKILGEKTRLYGNVFMDLHLFDVDREQNFVNSIDGDGTAFSLISEWGLMHDILNQYVVGNIYARAGYNFGFNVKETVSGDDYMRLKSDGYFILTPGYSLTAQKKIYPSAWFQIRPYASIGVEYDVFGAPDHAEYKFAPAERFTQYEINIDPLWANIGGGIEMLSAHGLQMGIDYRYQYNNDIQLHNIRVSGSYRF